VKVVKTKSGYHILKLLDKMIRQRGSFDAESADITKRLRRAKLQEDIGLTIDRMKGEGNVQR
jgi:parvulin-like peptidyl-prolyl isomerase